jgi:hypothetical protein
MTGIIAWFPNNEQTSTPCPTGFNSEFIKTDVQADRMTSWQNESFKNLFKNI